MRWIESPGLRYEEKRTRRSTNSGRNRYFLKIVSSGVKETNVPLRSSVAPEVSFTSSPRSNSTCANLPSRTERARNFVESALTAFVPTPFMPTENWKTSLLNLPPVLSSLTQSRSLPSGIPRP